MAPFTYCSLGYHRLSGSNGPQEWWQWSDEVERRELLPISVPLSPCHLSLCPGRALDAGREGEEGPRAKGAPWSLASLSELQAPGEARSLVSIATCPLGPAAAAPLGPLRRGLWVARASPASTAAPAGFRPEADCSFCAGALPDTVPMGTAVGTRCLWSDPPIQPALQFRQSLRSSACRRDIEFQVPQSLNPHPPPQPKNLGLCHTWGVSSVPGPRDTRRAEAQPLP